MTEASPWQVLGIAATRDETEIRRAYAQKLRGTRPEDDPIAFAQLRYAYEQALRLARADRRPPGTPEKERPAPADPGTAAAEASRANSDPGTLNGRDPSGAAAPEPASPREPEAATPDDPLHEARTGLQRHYLRLHQLGGSPSAGPKQLRAALDECLGSPALQNLQLQLEFEYVLAQFLAKTQPRTECLLEPAIEYFGWRARTRTTRATRPDLIRGLVTYADAARMLEAARTEAPVAHAALTEPPRGWELRAQVLLIRLDRSVHALLRQMGTPFPAGINQAALEWWQRYYATPQVRPELVWLTGVLALAGGVGGALASSGGDFSRNVVLGGIAGLLAGAGITLGALWLVDWPTHRLRMSRPAAGSWLQLGWAPAAVALCILSAAVVSNPVTVLLFTVLSLANVLWATVIARVAAPAIGTVTPRLLYSRILINLPILAWWLVSRDSGAHLVTDAMVPTLLGALVAFGFGNLALMTAFVRDLDRAQQEFVRVMVIALAVALLGVAWFQAFGNLACVIFAVMVGLTLVQRVVTLNLSAFQLQARYWIGAVWVMGASAGLTQVPSPPQTHTDLALHWGGTAFMGAIIVMVGASLYNSFMEPAGSTSG